MKTIKQEETIVKLKTKTNIGIIGCGKISSIYFETLRTFDILNVLACADIYIERAQEQAERYGIPQACTVEELLADPEIELVVNLTVPNAHAEIALAAIEAGKSVYSEKPLAINREEGQAVLNAARMKNLRVGNAPDTFLGGGIQTCIKLVNDGLIGTPIAATAFMMHHGVEHWHPDPDFYYQPGGGPMFDMGPYYLTALIALMGPIRRVTGTTHSGFAERTITSQPKYGTRITVNVPTHVAGVMDFASGAVGTIITSFDTWYHRLPHIEIYGAEGSLSVPDPNTFGGPVYIRQAGAKEWSEVPLTHSYTKNFRGIGVADMVDAMRSRQLHRANGEMAYHVLDIMQSCHEASSEGRHIELASTCSRPAPIDPTLPSDPG